MASARGVGRGAAKQGQANGGQENWHDGGDDDDDDNYHGDAEEGGASYRDFLHGQVDDADDEDETRISPPRSATGSVQRAIEAQLGIDGEHDEHHTLIASSKMNDEQNVWGEP